VKYYVKEERILTESIGKGEWVPVDDLQCERVLLFLFNLEIYLDKPIP